MSSASYRVRRATIDDLGELKALWSAMKFSAEELERRLTEFQVAESPDGKVVGCVGLLVMNRHGWIHSEGFTDFSLADTLRPMLWRRLQSLFLNHGIFRLWTQESSPFYSHNGLTPATEAELRKLPEPWRSVGGNWLTQKLKDEEAITSLDKEFALFMESEKARSEQAIQQARTLKTVVTVIAFILVLGVFAAAFFVWFNRQAVGSAVP